MMSHMTTTPIRRVRPAGQGTDPDLLRVAPDWELCDRMRRSLRLVRGLNSKEIAEIMGVRSETVSNWLNGRTKPNKPVLMIWSDVTGVDMQWLETGQASPDAVTPEELRACRDSNPKPSVWEPVVIQGGQSVKRDLTVFGPLAMYGALRPVASL